jgi:protein ImuB
VAALATVATGSGGRIIAVSEAAHAAGIRPGLSLADARALLPILAVTPADPPAERRVLGGFADWCSRYTPWTAIDPESGYSGPYGGGADLWLDVSGCAHLFGEEDLLLRDLVGRIEALGFTAAAAIAETAGAAWALARFGGQRIAIAPNGTVASALAPLPMRGLRLEAEVTATLHRLGLRRIGDLLPLPRAPLTARFGGAIGRRLDQALGRLDEPLSPRRPPPAFLARLAFAEPIGRGEDVVAALAHLLVDLCARLAAAQQGARRVELTAFRVDGTIERIAIGTSRPVRTPKHLQRLFGEKLERLDAGFGIEVITLYALVVDPLPPSQTLISLAGDGAARPENLAQLVDRLGNRLGSNAVVRLSEYPSHIPERVSREIPAMAGLAVPPTPAPTPAETENHRSRQPRPLHLLASPEPIEVIAPVPDGPPALFRWRRVQHRIAAVEGPERIGPEWWLTAAGHTPESQSRTRDYWRIEDIDGVRYWIYREGVFRLDQPPRWYLHGLFG